MLNLTAHKGTAGFKKTTEYRIFLSCYEYCSYEPAVKNMPEKQTDSNRHGT
jgi:hypothetical protein